MSILTQLDILCNVKKLNIIDIKFYLYLHKHCKRSGFIPAFAQVARELKCSTGAINNSYIRLIEHNVIIELRKKKIGYSYCYEFEFAR